MDNIVDLLLHRMYFINIWTGFLILYICNSNELNYTRYNTGRGLHAGHTRKASRISKAAVDNCGKGVGNLYLSYQTILVRYMHLCIISDVSRL